MNKKTAIILVVVLAIIMGALIWFVSSPTNIKAPNTLQPAVDQNTQLANPASTNCADRGGTLTIVKRGDGGEYGICSFEDNKQCEEWAMFRGDCPVGGLDVTGYATDVAKYCVITGGTYTVINEGIDTCVFKDGSSCDVLDYFNGGLCGK